ncbi:unnamed protein product [Protopolystoma xenopodis]|uniref:Uncharacterized protein n=1 Tax=Protopolystoma xenopodis TaxID=117903 RepID=A0A448XDR1_9PLAT|nr:unnamed protein product [Protopolystoma xenopodis]
MRLVNFLADGPIPAAPLSPNCMADSTGLHTAQSRSKGLSARRWDHQPICPLRRRPVMRPVRQETTSDCPMELRLESRQFEEPEAEAVRGQETRENAQILTGFLDLS